MKEKLIVSVPFFLSRQESFDREWKGLSDHILYSKPKSLSISAFYYVRLALEEKLYILEGNSLEEELAYMKNCRKTSLGIFVMAKSIRRDFIIMHNVAVCGRTLTTMLVHEYGSLDDIRIVEDMPDKVMKRMVYDLMAPMEMERIKIPTKRQLRKLFKPSEIKHHKGEHEDYGLSFETTDQQ